MPLLEARAGFEIENIVTIADKLFWHLRAEGTADLATREALRYRHALLGGCSAESIILGHVINRGGRWGRPSGPVPVSCGSFSLDSPHMLQ